MADANPEAFGHPHNLHLQAAQGWLELGNDLEANEELEQIKPELRSHPDVLEIRWHIYAHAKKWDECVDIAVATLIQQHFSENSRKA